MKTKYTELEKLITANEWQHISSAPQNRSLLLYEPVDGYAIGAFSKDGGDWIASGSGVDILHPTHFRCLIFLAVSPVWAAISFLGAVISTIWWIWS